MADGFLTVHPVAKGDLQQHEAVSVGCSQSINCRQNLARDSRDLGIDLATAAEMINRIALPACRLYLLRRKRRLYNNRRQRA